MGGAISFKKKLAEDIFLAILCDRFGMVKYPFQRLLVPSKDWGQEEGHFESPGLFIFAIRLIEVMFYFFLMNCLWML